MNKKRIYNRLLNNQGFTLIELLSVVVIIALVSGISISGIISTTNNSKLKSEKIFVDKLSTLIDDYLDLYPPTKKVGETITFTKCKDATCTKNYEVTANKVIKNDDTKISLSDLINEKIVSKTKLVNPKNKQQCYNDEFANLEVIVYKDSEYVYYYYLDLSGNNTTCDIADENAIINTLPDSLKSKVGLS